MKPKVAKFGGTSLAGAECFRQVKRLLLSDPARRIAVVSAPGKRWEGDEKVTDLLLNRKFDQAFSRFEETARELNIEPPERPEADLLRDPEWAVSRGEALCARLLADYMGWKFVDARELVRFDMQGELRLQETLDRLKGALCGGEKIVLPGFYGAREDGRIRTFPRGGSDITGALAAAAVGAQVYENWTDVCGVRLADPRLLPDAPRVEEMSYRQLRALARAGAQVIHPSAVEPVERMRIPLYIRNTFRPEAGGTCVHEGAAEKAGLVAMAGRAEGGKAQLTLVGNFSARQVSQVFERLSRAGIEPDQAHWEAGQECLRLVLPQEDALPRAVRALAKAGR